MLEAPRGGGYQDSLRRLSVDELCQCQQCSRLEVMGRACGSDVTQLNMR